MKSLKLLNTDYIENIRFAATKMHGSERRSFMAEMTLKYCEGNTRGAEIHSMRYYQRKQR